MKTSYILYTILAGLTNPQPSDINIVQRFITPTACISERDKLRSDAPDDIVIDCAKVEVLR